MSKDYDKPTDEKLGSDRDSKGHKHKEGTLEKILGDGRKDEDVSLHEKMLGDSREGAKETTTEGLLNAANGSYPHRNEKAWSRTKEKRPINALPEEMGKASDEGKVDRYEKASKPGEKRVVDKDVGSQRKAYNRKRVLQARNQAEAEAMVGDYLKYKSSSSHWAIHMNEAKKLDAMMADIMSAAAARQLNDNEKAQIEALKRRKSDVLKVAGTRPVTQG